MKRLLNRLLGRGATETPVASAAEHRARAEQLLAEGNTLEDASQFAEAELRYREALRLHPDFARAWLNLGNVQLAREQPNEAAASYREALRREPGYGAAHANLGRLYLGQKDYRNAAEHYAMAVRALPDSADALVGLGCALEELERHAEAADAYQKALAIQPDFVAARRNLIRVLTQLVRLDEVERHLEDLLANTPDDGDSHAQLALLLARRGEMSKAESRYRQALALQPDNFQYAAHAHLLLPVIPESFPDIAFWRQRYQAGIAELHNVRGTKDLHGEFSALSFYLAYHNENDRPIMESLCQLFRAKLPALTFTAPHVSDWQPSSARSSRIRVGFSSQVLHSHTIGKLFQGFIRHLDRRRFEVVLIHAGGAQKDEFSQHLDTLANKALTLPPSSSLVAQQQAIAAEGLDVLFYPDIGFGAISYLLAYARLAPVQAVSWGHPDTTGLDTMDYFVSAASIEPTDAEDHYSERLIRLNRLPCFYQALVAPTSIPTRAALGLPETGVLYGCPQTLFKIHPEFDAILAAIAEGDPAGRIVMLEGSHTAWMNLLKARWTKTFPILLERVLFLPRLPLDRFMALMAHIDVLLDPIHFGSGNTLYEAMVYGTPVVTWPGRFMRGRLVAGAYQQMGVADAPVVERLEDYAALALVLGRDPERRRALRQASLAAAETLFADMQAVREFETFLEAAVAAAGRGEKLPPGWRPKTPAASLQPQDSLP